MQSMFMQKIKTLDYGLISLILVALLMFVWPISHTTQIRYILIVFIAIYLVSFSVKNKIFSVLFSIQMVNFLAIVLLLTTAWFYFGAIFLSNYTLHSLREISTQWLLSVACFFLGLLFAFTKNSSSKVLLAIFITLIIHNLSVDYNGIKLIFETGEFHDKLDGFVTGRDRANVLTNISVAILLTEALFRVIVNKRLLPIGGGLLALATIISFAAVMFEGNRHGMIGLFFMFLTIAGLAFYLKLDKKSAIRLLTMSFFIGVLTVAVVMSNIHKDKRWSGLLETIELALDIENNKAWISLETYPLPLLRNGEVANVSNYTRPAWFVGGLSFMAESPLGSGYARDAFGRYRKAKFGLGREGRYAHSSFIDIGVGGGIPGLLGWLIFVVGLAYMGLRDFVKKQTYFSLLLLFLAGGFFFRMLVDSIAKDHMLEQFFFLAGLFLAFSIREQKNIIHKPYE